MAPARARAKVPADEGVGVSAGGGVGGVRGGTR